MRPALILAVLFGVTGCQYDPYAHTYTTEEPKASHLVGSYNLTEQTVTPGGLAALKGRPCRIELHEDGTFAATGLPRSTFTVATPHFFNRLSDAEGTWRIDRIGAVDDRIGPLKDYWGVRLDTDPARILTIGLMGDGPPYGLIITIGDPDGGDVLIFQKAG
jgi:hypothetical protein